MKKIRLLAVLNFLSFGIQLAVTWMVQRKMINEYDVAEISKEYATLITPAGLTFGIWGVIYLFLLVFSIYHIVISWKSPSTAEGNRNTEKIGALFILNNLATAAWLYYWTHGWLLAALFLILLQLITLGVINRRLAIYDRLAGLGSKLITQPAFGIYLGWITVATIENIAAFLYGIDWEAFGLTAVSWAMIFMGLAVFIALCMIFFGRNIMFGLVVIWALTGIILRNTANGGANYPVVVVAAGIGILITGLAALIQLARNISFHRTGRSRGLSLFPEEAKALK